MESSHLLHGTLHVTVYEAVELIHEHRKSASLFKKICTCCGLFVEEIEHLTHLGKGLSKLYATVDLGLATVARTRIKERELFNPEWNESFHIYCAYEAQKMTISVKDNLPLGAVVVGRAHIPVAEFFSGEEVDRWFHICSEKNDVDKRGKIHVRLQFVDVKHDPLWGAGISKDPEFTGVPHTFFPHLKGNRIRLYQDAHMPDHFTPNISLEGGSFYQPTHCWEDIYKAIEGAQHLIYIAGWSVFTKITLVRDRNRMIPGADFFNLGEILKKKASEGVRVLLLVWDDRTSIPVLKRNGLMQTHDEDTGSYFRGSQVHCVLCPRNPDDCSGIVQGLEIGLMFTHHQKTLVVDSPVPGDDSTKRRIVSFVGGIDLCDGRYDTQFHSLFRTLGTVHRDDFHQPNFEGASLEHGGPREPWHDVHSMLEGPVAWDVLCNFEHRWKKQGKKGLLLPLEKISNIIPPTALTSDDHRETWNSQVFRSIDEGAVTGFPYDPKSARELGLISGKENTIDRSIQDAYINAIRRAKNFIYIENQYFLGSSASWSSSQGSGALQLIPMELTLKIVSKIEAGERFAVYIVVPMWPEGVPESSSVQAILHWQRLTMEMMYKHIAKAIEAKGLEDASPTDYLHFFCLGNREEKLEGELEPPDCPPTGSNYARAQENRRFMIYVHAKTMIVDDEYIIVGSANCNQRSLDGARDSEIAHGSYQPNHLASPGPARGEIHGFRMSLWHEHTGRVDEDFLHPESLECMRKMKKISGELWGIFTGEKNVDMRGHLLPYPICVSDDGLGTITDLPGYEHFPDTKAPVKGTKENILPPLLTT